MCKVQRYTLHNLAHQDNTNIGPRGWQPGDQADTGKPGRLQALLCLASQAGICKLCWLPPPACHPLPLGTAGLWSSSHLILVHLQIFFLLILIIFCAIANPIIPGCNIIRFEHNSVFNVCLFITVKAKYFAETQNVIWRKKTWLKTKAVM